MNPQDLPVHWSFASAQAFDRLQGLIWCFDFLKLADGHTYTGARPDYLLEVIDGFLGEDVLWGGSRTQLQNLRVLLIERVKPAFEDGLAEGVRQWREGDRVYGSIPVGQLHRLALGSAPEDTMTQGWFAEGFCFAYAHEEMESLRGEP